MGGIPVSRRRGRRHSVRAVEAEVDVGIAVAFVVRASCGAAPHTTTRHPPEGCRVVSCRGRDQGWGAALAFSWSAASVPRYSSMTFGSFMSSRPRPSYASLPWSST